MAEEETKGFPIYTAPLDGDIKRYLVLNKRFFYKCSLILVCQTLEIRPLFA